MTDIEIEKIHAETVKIMLKSQKLGKELRWYEVTVVIAITLAIVAVTKLFL